MIQKYHNNSTRFERGFLLKEIKNAREVVVNTTGNNKNEWHLQEASEIWLNEIIKDLFEIKKIEMYPKIFKLKNYCSFEKKIILGIV